MLEVLTSELACLLNSTRTGITCGYLRTRLRGRAGLQLKHGLEMFSKWVPG